MSTDRGRRRTPRGGKGPAQGPRLVGVQLAPGVKLDGGKAGRRVYVLVWPDGQAELNDGAAAILRLCDGSRDRAQIVAEAVRLSGGSTLASDINDFLDAARARGWTIEH